MPVSNTAYLDATSLVQSAYLAKKLELTHTNPEPQVFPHEGQACQSTKAESSYSPVDPIEDWKHNPVSEGSLSLDKSMQDEGRI